MTNSPLQAAQDLISEKYLTKSMTPNQLRWLTRRYRRCLVELAAELAKRCECGDPCPGCGGCSMCCGDGDRAGCPVCCVLPSREAVEAERAKLLAQLPEEDRAEAVAMWAELDAMHEAEDLAGVPRS
jgi:hypothetical protein